MRDTSKKMMPEKTTSEKAISIKVWDAPVRLFHWLLVALVGFSWYTGENGRMELHIISGTSVFVLLLFRLFWGFFGSETALFHKFLRRPKAAMEYARGLMSGTHSHATGHNPLGGWMVVLILLALAVQVGSGLFANDDIFTEGPLAYLVDKGTSDNLTRIHKINFNIVLGLAAVHIAAVLGYLFIKHDNLVRPMITGRKPASQLPPGAAPRLRSPLLGLVFLGLAGALVWWIYR